MSLNVGSAMGLSVPGSLVLLYEYTGRVQGCFMRTTVR